MAIQMCQKSKDAFQWRLMTSPGSAWSMFRGRCLQEQISFAMTPVTKVFCKATGPGWSRQGWHSATKHLFHTDELCPKS